MLRWIEGFEVANSQTMLDRRYGPMLAVGFGAGRRGGTCVAQADTLGTFVFVPPNSPVVAERAWIVGLAIYFSDIQSVRLINFRSGASEQCSIWMVRDSASEAHIEVRTGAGVLGATPILPRQLWYFLEAKVLCDDTAGRVEVRIDQVPVIELTGVDTRAFAGATTIDRVEIGFDVTAGCEWRLDDIYVASDPSFDALPFLGDVSAVGLAPVRNGRLSDWGEFPAAASHVTLVDDGAPDDDSTFIEGFSGANDTDLFGYTLGEGLRGRVAGLMHASHRRVDIAGPYNFRHVIDDAEAATLVEGPIESVSGAAWAETRSVVETNVAGVAIERQDIDRLEHGVRVV